jgi:hypothetical protein
MIFFTRALQDGIQEESGWTRRALRPLRATKNSTLRT